MKQDNTSDTQFVTEVLILLMSLMSKKNVRLLTLNVFLRPPPIKTNLDDYKEQRFLQIMKIIQNYDVVCFQEMFQMGTFRPERIIEEGIKQKFFYWKMSEPPSFFPGPVVDSGLLIMSKYPIISSYFESYNIGILSDSASDKGYIYCKIKVGDEILHLFSTHLQASYKLPGKQFERQLSVRTRLYQFDILLTKIQHHLRTNVHNQSQLVILVGDLNVDSNQKPFMLTNNSYLQRKGPVVVSSAFQENGTHLEFEHVNSGGFKQYQNVMSIFQKHQISVIDHALIQHEGHPVTFGDNQTILTGKEDTTSFQSLDYIFTLKMPNVNDLQCNKLKVKTSTCMVQQFKYPGTLFGQLSDHYGMSVLIE